MAFIVEGATVVGTTSVIVVKSCQYTAFWYSVTLAVGTTKIQVSKSILLKVFCGIVIGDAILLLIKSKFIQRAKAKSPIELTLLGIVIAFKYSQFENAE